MDLTNSKKLAEIFENWFKFRGEFALISLNEGIDGVMHTMELSQLL